MLAESLASFLMNATAHASYTLPTVKLNRSWWRWEV
jgi:hypothetical protein